MAITRWIEVSFQKEGIHKYPAALTDERLKDVSFLGHPHRHMFHFYVKVEVFHNDRDIEFILLKRELEALYGTKLELDYKSCEMIAEELLHYIIKTYSNRRKVEVRVYEDNENGAVLEYVSND